MSKKFPLPSAVACVGIVFGCNCIAEGAAGNSAEETSAIPLVGDRNPSLDEPPATPSKALGIYALPAGLLLALGVVGLREYRGNRRNS